MTSSEKFKNDLKDCNIIGKIRIEKMKSNEIIKKNFEIIMITLLGMISVFSFYMFYMLRKTIDTIEKNYCILSTQHDELNKKHNVLLQKYEELVTSNIKSELEISTIQNLLPVDSSSNLLMKSIKILAIIFLILSIIYVVSQIQFQIPILSPFVKLLKNYTSWLDKVEKYQHVDAKSRSIWEVIITNNEKVKILIQREHDRNPIELGRLLRDLQRDLQYIEEVLASPGVDSMLNQLEFMERANIITSTFPPLM